MAASSKRTFGIGGMSTKRVRIRHLTTGASVHQRRRRSFSENILPRNRWNCLTGLSVSKIVPTQNSPSRAPLANT